MTTEILYPIFFALVFPPLALGTLARLHRTSRSATWYWRAWWFYGYHCGFYRINWWWKRRA